MGVTTISNSHFVRARKKHQCDMCEKTIEKGEIYDSATYKEDGVIYNWKMCKRCEPYVIDFLSDGDYDPSEGFADEHFYNFMWEYYRDVALSWWGD